MRLDSFNVNFSPLQLQVLSEATARWNLLVGATRSGKTWLTYYLICLRAFQQPTGNCLLVGKTLGTIEQNVLGPMRRLFPGCIGQMGGGIRRTVSIFGREFICVGANDKRSGEKVQGIGLVYAYGDEVTTWAAEFFQMLKSRLSDDGAMFDGTCNPDNPSHWLKTDMIDRADELDVRYWHFTLDDNPFLSPSFVANLKAEYTGVWYQRFVLGRWVAGEGAIYDMLDPEVHVVDVLPQMTAYYVGVDYGTSGVTTFWLLGLGVDHKLYFVDFWRWDVEKRHRQLSDAQTAVELDNWLDSLQIKPKTIVIPRDAASFVVELQNSKRAGRVKNIGNLAWANMQAGSVLMGLRDQSYSVVLSIPAKAAAVSM